MEYRLSKYISVKNIGETTQDFIFPLTFKIMQKSFFSRVKSECARVPGE